MILSPPPLLGERKMMTREDINDLFSLFAVFRPNDPHLSNKKLRYAWYLVLSPYDRDDVREAVGAWFRRSKYWPEPAEIAALCPHLPEKKRQEKSLQAVQEAREDVRNLHERWSELKRLRRSAGIPETIQKAKSAGLSNGEWFDLLAERGMGWM